MVCITAKAKWKRLTILRATFNPRDRWTFQIDDHLKPPAVAKRCIFRDSLNAPRCGAFRPGGGALATTSLYPSTKIERPQRTRNGTPRRRSSSGIECSGWPGSPRHGCPRQPPPHTRPNTAEIPVPVELPRLRSETGTQGAHGRDSGFLLPVRLVLEYAGCSRCKVGAGFCPQKAFGGRLRQARCSACPTRGWVMSVI